MNASQRPPPLPRVRGPMLLRRSSLEECRAFAHAAAVIWKRGWASDTEGARATLWLRAAELQRAGPAGQVVCAMVVRAVVDEMGGRRQTRMGVTRADHDAAATAFASKGGLAACAELATQGLAAARAAAAGAGGGGGGGGEPASTGPAAAPEWVGQSLIETAEALRQAVAASAWAAGAAHRPASTTAQADDEATVAVTVGGPLARALLDGRLVVAACNAFTWARRARAVAAASALMRLLAALANVSSGSFDPVGRACAGKHVATLAPRLCFVVHEPGFDTAPATSTATGAAPAAAAAAPLAASGSEPSRLAAAADVLRCQAAAALARLAAAAGFAFWHDASAEAAASGQPDPLALLLAAHGTVLGHQKSQASALASAIAAGQQHMADSRRDAYESTSTAAASLLAAWASLVADATRLAATVEPAAAGGGARAAAGADATRGAGILGSPAAAQLVLCCGKVYVAAADCRFACADALVRCGDDDEDPFGDDSVQEEEMQSLACVGRACPAAAAAYARRAVEASAERSAAAAAATAAAAAAGNGCGAVSVADAAAAHEALTWALSFAANLLADSGRGETPAVPPTLAAVSAAASGPDRCPLVQLVATTTRVAEREATRPGAGAAASGLSPAVVSASLQALRRVAGTYFFVQPSPTMALRAAFGAGRDGSGAPRRICVGLVVRCACGALAAWPGEERVAEEASRLLALAVGRPSRAQLAVAVPEWTGLHTALEGGIRVRILELAGQSPAAAARLSSVAAALALDPGKAAEDVAGRSFARLAAPTLARVAGSVAAGNRGIEDEGLCGARFTSSLRLLDAWASAAVASELSHEVEAAMRCLTRFVVASGAPPEWHLHVVGRHVAGVATAVSEHGAQSVVATVALAFSASIVDAILPELPAGHTAALAPHLRATFEALTSSAAGPPAAASDGSETVMSMLALLRAITSKSRMDMATAPSTAAEDEAASRSLADAALAGMLASATWCNEERLGCPDIAVTAGSTLGNAVDEFSAQLLAADPAMQRAIVVMLATGAKNPNDQVAVACVRALTALVDALATQQAPALGSFLAGLPAVALSRAVTDFESVALASATGHLLVASARALPTEVDAAFAALSGRSADPGVAQKVDQDAAAIAKVFADRVRQPTTGPARRRASAHAAGAFAEFCFRTGSLLATF